MLVRLVVAAFGVIQTLLSVRLVLGFVDVPAALREWVPTLIAVTDVLIAPFRGISPPPGIDRGFGIGQLDAAVLVALVGWSITELVVLAVVRVATRPSDG